MQTAERVVAPDAPRRTSTAASDLLARGGRRALTAAVLPALGVAAVAWLLTARSSSMDMVGAGAFVAAWVVMMVAMMLPAVAPVAGLYVLAARRRVVAAVPFFVAGYLCVWAASAAPAYLISRAVTEPLMDGRSWAARLVGGTLIAAGVYQLTPLKAACLRACRSPLAFFTARRGSLARPTAAVVAGAQHGIYCLGCCWALMAVLMVLGGMQLGWALALALVISAEKLVPFGEVLARGAAALCLALGLSLIAMPSLIDHLIQM